MSEFDDWKARKFEGLTHEQLRTAGVLLGCTFGPQVTDRVMRVKLCEKLGEIPHPNDLREVEPEPKKGKAKDAPKAEEAKPVKMVRMTRPRVSPADLPLWEGRKYRVQVAKGEGAQKHKSFILYWNFVARAFAYDTIIDIPEPYYDILKNSKIGTVIQHDVQDEKNIRIGTWNEDVFTPRFSFRDFGVTPGTENLPGSILEYWQMEAKDKNYFRDLPNAKGGRNKLIQIRADLYGSVGVGFYKDLTNEDIWQDIIRFLGFEDIFYEDYEAA